MHRLDSASIKANRALSKSHIFRSSWRTLSAVLVRFSISRSVVFACHLFAAASKQSVMLPCSFLKQASIFVSYSAVMRGAADAESGEFPASNGATGGGNSVSVTGLFGDVIVII